MANAPHVPVHLGAMGESVRTVLRLRRETLAGDVVALNNPYNGGTHLPDVTVITPVFDAAGRDILFFVPAAGTTPISAASPRLDPACSRTLEEEGVVLDNFLLVDAGQFREAEFRASPGIGGLSGAQPRHQRRRHQGPGRGQQEGRQERRGGPAATAWRPCAPTRRHVYGQCRGEVSAAC